MSSLIITKQSGNFFSLVLDGGAPIISEQNRLTTIGDFCNFKTSNGANLVLKQNILVSEITLIASGTFTFVNVNSLWNKLIEVGFFAGIYGAGGGGAIDRFDELLDTFSYFGRDGQLLIVNEAEVRLDTVSYQIFTEADKIKLNGIETGAQVNVNPDWNITDPLDKRTIFNKPDLTASQFPKIQFIADGTQDTFDMGTIAVITAVFWNSVLLNDDDWSQTGTTFTLTFTPTAGDLIKPI